MKRILISLATALITILGISAQNTYNMVIEMNDGTKINIGPNDIKNMTFTDGNLVVSGESIDEITKKVAELKQKQEDQDEKVSLLNGNLTVNLERIDEIAKEIAELKKKQEDQDDKVSLMNGNLTVSVESIDNLKKEIAELKKDLEEQKKCECSAELAALKQEIANLKNSDVKTMIDELQNQIYKLMVEVDAIKNNSGNNDSQGGGNDDQGGSDSSTTNSQLVGVWYQYIYSSIVGFCFYADGTGWKGEWLKGRSEEHRPLTWTVEGNRLRTYNANDGDQLDDYTYSISGDGNTLTLTDTKTGYSEEFKKQ